MEILVCVTRVPDTAKNEIKVNEDGSDIKRNSLVYSVNEWDNYAVEEAIQIRDRVGGTVTVLTIDDEDGNEVLRRELAMGADKGILVSDEAFKTLDGQGIAAILKTVVEQGSYDLILTGAQSEGGAGEVGGMLAAMLDIPYASLVISIEEAGDDTFKVGREIEGGNIEMNEISLPCVLSVQTGINEPRYTSIIGIRRAAKLEIPELNADMLGVSTDVTNARVKRLDYFVPELSTKAEMLEGDPHEIVAKLVKMLRAKGGLK